MSLPALPLLLLATALAIAVAGTLPSTQPSTLHLTLPATLQPYDDFHYPVEETAEAKAASTPVLVAIANGVASLLYKGAPVHAKVGDDVGDWRLVGLRQAPAFAVVEREWARWGMLVILRTDGSSIPLRKSVGDLASIRQPYFNFTGADPDYFTRIAAGLNDVASAMAANLTVDGEADYSSLAATLAPQVRTCFVFGFE